MRNLDIGIEDIPEEAVKGQLKRQALEVYMESAALAIILTFIVVLLPF